MAFNRRHSGTVLKGQPIEKANLYNKPLLGDYPHVIISQMSKTTRMTNIVIGSGILNNLACHILAKPSLIVMMQMSCSILCSS